MIAVAIGCNQPSPYGDEPPTVVTLRATELSGPVEVILDSVTSKGEVWRSVEVKQDDVVALASGSEHRLKVQAIEPARPDSTQSEISYESLQPGRVLLTAVLKDFAGVPVKNLALDVDSPTLRDDQIHPVRTETDPNGLLFSIIEAPVGSSHTIYLMLNGAPLLFKNVHFPAKTGLLVVTSEPGNASVYLNQDGAERSARLGALRSAETPQGVTPLKVTLNRLGRFTIRVEHPDYEAITDTVAVTDEQPVVRHYILTPIEVAPLPVEQEPSQPPPEKGTLVVTSQPDAATVYLDRETIPRGTTPLVLLLGLGPHAVRIQKPGYQPITDTIRLTAQQPVIKNHRLEPIEVAGTLTYEATDTPVTGAIVTIEELYYSVLSDATGQFRFDDWESHPPPDLTKKYTLRISDLQARFLPKAREFDMTHLPLGKIGVQRVLTISVFVSEQATGKPLPGATVSVNAQVAQKGNREGLSVARVADSEQPIVVFVKHEGYETLQGKPFYEDTFPALPNESEYFLPVTLTPLSFVVELPADWAIPDKPNIRFVAKRSAQDEEGVQGELTGKQLVFPYASFFATDKPVYVEMLQNTMRLRGRGLEVKRYRRSNPNP